MEQGKNNMEDKIKNADFGAVVDRMLGKELTDEQKKNTRVIDEVYDILHGTAPEE